MLRSVLDSTPYYFMGGRFYRRRDEPSNTGQACIGLTAQMHRVFGNGDLHGTVNIASVQPTHRVSLTETPLQIKSGAGLSSRIDFSRTLGSVVHEEARQIANAWGLAPRTPLSTILRSYSDLCPQTVDLFRALDRKGLQPVAGEVAVGFKDRQIATGIDLVCQDASGGVVLIELKTNQSELFNFGPARIPGMPDWVNSPYNMAQIQIVLGARMFAETFNIQPRQLYVVRAFRTIDMFECTLSDLERQRIFDMFVDPSQKRRRASPHVAPSEKKKPWKWAQIMKHRKRAR